jgi:hypothetical protein
MAFTRGQTQVLYRFLPGAIFEHEQYGFCRVTAVDMRESNVNAMALFDGLTDLLQKWQDLEMRPGFPDPRDERNRRSYTVGVPHSVQFEPYPTLLECRGCGRVYRLSDLKRARGASPGRCLQCNQPLNQLRYVQAHNCGRLEELYYPLCPKHGSSYITFLDTGRVRSARWRCGACGGAELGRLRMTPCNCAYSRRAAEDRRSASERYLNMLVTTDRALYMPHIFPFINFEPKKQEFVATEDQELVPIVLARTWGILDTPVDRVLKERLKYSAGGTEGATKDNTSAEMAAALERIDPNHPLVKRWRELNSEGRTPPGEAAAAKVRSLLGELPPGSFVPRQLLEHTAILDTLKNTTVDTAAGWNRERGDTSGAEALTKAARDADRRLGIARFLLVEEFPIALCGAGYTRMSRDPARSVLVPFSTATGDGRIPLYVVTAETEGIYFQLDPLRVATWLTENGFVAGAPPKTLEQAWAWIWRLIPGLRQNRWDHNFAEAPAVAARTLLHTISHALLRHVEWSGFSSDSIGEYLVPSALACVLYANRYAETKIGGLATLFEQQLGIWLEDAVQSARQCTYDPFCSDEGGSCVGCLHREYNCPSFNSELSRAVLYGGPLPQTDHAIATVRRGFWS